MKRAGELCKKIQGNVLVTGKGIRIGDTIEKVVSVYGQPQESESNDDVFFYGYHTDYEKDPDVELYYDMFLSFKNGKLVSIDIHDGE